MVTDHSRVGAVGLGPFKVDGRLVETTLFIVQQAAIQGEGGRGGG